MALVVALITTLTLFLPVMAETYNPACDFTGWDLDTAVAKVLSNLPKHHVPYVHGFRKVFEGVEAGPVNVTGLNTLNRHGPLVPYCFGANRLLSVELVNKGEAYVSLPLRACTGQEASLVISAELSRFTVVFNLASGGPGQEVNLTYSGPILPLTTVYPKVTIRGIGRPALVTSEILSTVFQGVTQRVWNDYFFIYVRGAIRAAISEAFQ